MAASYGIRHDQAGDRLFASSSSIQKTKSLRTASVDGARGSERDESPLGAAASFNDQRPGPDQPPADPNTITRVGFTVADGETLTGVLTSTDVTTNEAQAAVEAIRKVYDPRKLKPGQIVTVAFRPASSPLSSTFQGFEIEADGGRVVMVQRDAGGFSATVKVVPTTTETHAVHGVIQNSLIESAEAAGLPYAITASLIKAFSYDVDFQRDIQPEDRFKVLFTTQVTNAASRPGDVLYAELILSGKPHAIYGVRRDEGVIEYFTRDGRSIKKGLLKTPVDGARLTSGFGMRMHPILGFTRMHKGVDFGVPTGTPIYAAGDGVVEFSGWAGGYGRFVKIRHTTHMETAYGHMSRVAATLGEQVHQGEVIGYVGMTGDATGPHLHYEVVKDGSQVNPISVTLPISTGLEGKELVAFLRAAEERENRYAALDDAIRFAAIPAKQH